MEAVVLAGGFGTRLREVVKDVPKPMAPVAGRPFLEILLATLARKGITRAVLSLGHLADVVVNHFGNRFQGIDLVYEIERAPLGTGGAVRASLPHCQSDPVFVFNGDTFLDLELDALAAAWHNNPVPTIVARRVDDTARYGRLLVEGDQVVGFSEKGVAGPGLINAGCYMLPRDALDAFAIGKPFSLEADYFVPTVRKAEVGCFVTQGLFIDIGVPDDYFRAQTELAGYCA